MEKELFTKGAFSQARAKLSPEAFEYLSDFLTKEIYKESKDLVTWKGFRLLATDGSTIQLPYTKAICEEFGTQKNGSGTDVPRANVSVIYDVLNNYIVSGEMVHVNTPERESALRLINKVPSGFKDLHLYDRGYPSFDFFYHHLVNKKEFVARTKVSYYQAQAFMQSNKISEVTVLTANRIKHPDRPYKTGAKIRVRFVKVELDSGITELLITSLTDQEKYPNELFKDLYFKRWKVETFYDEFKNKLKAEYFTGLTINSLLQDFYIALFISNIQSLITNELNQEIEERTKDRKYKYKVNTNLSYGFMKDRIIDLFHKGRPIDQAISELKFLFAQNLVPIIPDRKETRELKKYRRRLKPKNIKNHKDSI